MNRTYPSHVSVKKHQESPKTDQHLQNREEEITNKQTIGLISKFTRGKQSLSLQMFQEQQLPNSTTDSRQLEKSTSSNKNEYINGKTDPLAIHHVSVFSQTQKDFTSRSSKIKYKHVKTSSGFKSYSPKFSYSNGLLKSTVEVRDALANTSISHQPETCKLSNLPESKLTYGRKVHEQQNLYSLNETVQGRHDILDVPVENPLDVTMAEPPEFDVSIVNDHILDEDIRHVPLGITTNIKGVEADIEASEWCTTSEEFYPPAECTSVDSKENPNFVIDIKKVIKPVGNVKIVCGNRLTVADLSSHSIDESSMLFEDLEIEIMDTSYSVNNKSSVHVDEITILEDTNNSNDHDKISTSPLVSRKSTLRSSVSQLKKNDDTVSPISVDDLSILEKANYKKKSQQSALSIISEISSLSGIKRENDNSLLTSNSSSHRSSVLAPEKSASRTNQNETLEDMKQCYSVDITSTFETPTISPERSSLISTFGKKDTSLILTPSLTTRPTRKLRSSMRQNQDSQVFPQNHNETAVTLDHSSPNSSSQSQHFVSQSNNKKTLSPFEDKPLLQVSTLNKHIRKFTLRSGSSAMNKSGKLEVNVVNLCFSSDNYMNCSNTKEIVEPEGLPKQCTTSLPLDNSYLYQTPSTNIHTRKSTLRPRRSVIHQIGDEGKIVNIHCSYNGDSATSVVLDNITSPNECTQLEALSTSCATSNCNMRSSLAVKDVSLSLIPSSNTNTRKSTLRSKCSAIYQSEAQEASHTGNDDKSLALNNTTCVKSTNEDIASGLLSTPCDSSLPLEDGMNPSNISNSTELDQEDNGMDDILFLTPRSYKKSRRSAQRSQRKNLEILDTKIVNIHSGDDSDTSLPFEDVMSSSNIGKGAELDQKDNGKGDLLFLPSGSNKNARKSTMRSQRNKNEDLDTKIVNTFSGGDIDVSLILENIMSPINSSKSRDLNQKDNGTRKSALRSQNNKNIHLDTKIVNMNSDDVTDTSLTLGDVISPRNINKNIELVQKGNGKEDYLLLTPSLSTSTRKSTLRSGRKHDEDLYKIVNARSGDDTDKSLTLEGTKTPNSSSQTTEPDQKDDKVDFLSVTPCSNTDTRKSTLRSQKNLNEYLGTKIVNTHSADDTDECLALEDNISKNIELNQKDNENVEGALNDSLTLPSDYNKSTRKSSMRSRSLEVRNSCNDNEPKNNDLSKIIITRSLSQIDHGNSSSKENILNSISEHKHSGALVIEKNDGKFQQSIKNKILKVVVVPMKNLTLDGRAHGKTIKHNIEPSSHLSDHRTTKNNLIELEPHNGIERNTQSNDVVQNCNSDSIVSQNQELVSLDKPFVQNDIPNVSANESLPRKANRKKTDDKSSFEFVSPRLQAKQLQQMGLITEDTSFAFYSAVDSVLAEIKVSQKQHKLNSQERTEYTEKTEEIIENGHKVDITEETKPVDVSTVSYATATRTENLMKSSNDQNDDEPEDTGITKNKKSRISFQSTSVGSRNSDASNTEQSLEELIVDRQQFCKDNGAVVTQNSGIHETTLDITASNKLTTSEIAAKSAQTSVGGILVHLSNERKDVEGLNVHCTSHISLADKLVELKCDTGNLNFGENMPPIQRRDRPRKLCEDTILKEQRAEESSLVVMDSFSRTKRKGSTRISIGSMENSIVSIKKNLSQVHSNIGVTENSKIKRGKGRPRKSKNSSLLKETIVSLAENTITVNKESKTYDAPLECRDIINETLEVIQRSASRNFSPETRITRSRSQELVEMHDPVPNSTNHYLLSPEYSIVHGENSFEHKLLQISESSSTSSKANTSVRLTEIQRKSVGDDQKTQQSESGMHTKRGGMTYSYELTSKSNANLDRLQTDSELDISAVVPVMNKTSTKVSPDSVELEKNNKQIGYHKERFDLDMDYDNKTKSIEKWVKDHVELVNAVSKSFEPNHYSETNFVTNHRIPKEKTQTRKESVPRRSLTRGRKLVAMLEDDNKESMTKETKIEDIRDNCHEAALQNTIPQNEEESDQIRRLARSNNSMLEQQTLLENKVQNDRKDFAEVSECTKSNPRIDEKSDQIRRSTRGSNSIEQQRLMEDYAQDANQNNKLENKQLVNRPENSHDTDTENNGNEAEAKSGDSLDETKTRSRMMGYRTTTSILLDREMSPEDTTEYTRRLSSASDDGQSGPEANGSNKIAPEQRRRPATSMRKKGKKCISASWSSRRSRSKSVCPSGSDMKSFKHGDLTWAQIGSYPYWPCMVRCAPNTTEVTKIYYIGRGIRTAYHVQFFGDQGRRAWINVTRIMPFNSSNDLKDMVERLAAEEGGYNMFYQPFMFKSRSKQVNKKLQVAADEAESMKSKTIEEKLKFFEDVINKQQEGQSSCTKKVSSIKSAKSKRTSGDMECLPSMKIARVTEESTTKSRRTIKVGSTEESKQNEVLKAEGEEPDDDKKDIENTPKPAKLALMLPPLEELYSIEAQKTLFKRNNLFKGMSKDKVCHYCLEPGDVLRCSAKCNGIYHLECSRMVMYNKIGGKRQASLKCSPSMKSDGERSESGEADDSHVQIVTVQSSIYNTPPRKNFPPDFDSLSLAEQIDYKMKEVMRKFESKTTYANESSRSASASSEDNGSDEKVVIRHVAADSVIEEVVPKPKKAKNNVAVKLFSKLEEANENSDFKTPNNLLVNRHVTADDVAFEALMADSKNFKCSFCLTDVEPNCFVCHERISSRGSEVRQKCSLYHCGRYFHPSCLKMWPQTQWSIIQLSKSKNVSDSFVCPQHVCHTCVSDDPRAATSRCSCDKIVKCMLCPRSYHSSNLCIPAGTKILSTSQIICPSHRKRANSLCINTTWCFLCSEGGNLICCETCPTSVHPECLPVNLTDDGKFICEDCESGRLPLYDEIVWVKLGHFRWWPAVILFPNEVPSNVNMVKHYTGDFVVRFFGTYNYYWVNRGRSFLFQDGDTGDGNNKIKKLDKEFKKAVEEATLAHKLKQEFKNTQQVESPSSQKPPPYIKIKVNKPVGNVRQLDLDLSNTTACNCDPNQENPCGPDSDCLNRLLMTECNPEVCPAGSRCRNQSFEKREYPPIAPYKTHARGWGLKTLMPIKKGQFVIEYVGEIIDTEEYQRRIQKMHEQKEENYYFLTIDNQRMLDAGPKGNLARFMNHCCQPNCETQKWTVKGETRVGLFATMDIPADTELTFNYNLECVGKEKKVCRCGAPNCSGFIGVKAKQDDLAKPVKVTKKKIYKKKRKLTEPVVSQPCFICNKKDNVFTCNNKICNKAYHLKCLKLDADNFDASRFICPWHSCDICSKRTIRCCVKCIRSYCPQHSDGKISHYSTVGFVCFKHDRMRYSRKDNINHATGQQSRSLSRNRKVNEAPLNLNKNMKRKKDKSNRTLLQHKGAFTDTSTTDTESDAPLSRRLKKIRPSIPMQTEATSGMPSSGYEEIDDIPLAQRLSSAISISKTPQPDTSKDEESNFEAVSEGAKNTTVDPAQSLREKQKYRNSEIETHLAATGSEIELCNVSETKATDETQTPSEESTVHIKDLPSSDSNTVASKTSTKEQSQDEVHDIENKQDIPKTKGQLKEYPINVEIDDSSEAAAYQHPTSIETENSNENDSISKASQQDLNTEIKNSCEAVAVDDISERYVQRDDRAVTENHSELLKNSAPQSSKQGVDKSTSSIAKLAHMNDSTCNASPVQECGDKVESNLPNEASDDITSTSRPPVDNSESERTLDPLTEINGDLITEVDAELSSKLVSDNGLTDDSQDKGEKLEVKKRKRKSHRLNTRKKYK